jgi:hypothetical protein
MGERRITDWRDELDRVRDELDRLPPPARRAVLELVERFRREDAVTAARAGYSGTAPSAAPPGH